MKILDNINHTVREDLQDTMQKGSRVSIAAACFSIYAYQELKKQLEEIAELRFIFTHLSQMPCVHISYNLAWKFKFCSILLIPILFLLLGIYFSPNFCYNKKLRRCHYAKFRLKTTTTASH